MKPWFRWYRGSASDIKFKTVAMDASAELWPDYDDGDPPVTVRDVIAVWATILERTEDNGRVTVSHGERNGEHTIRYIATALGLSEKAATAIVNGLLDYGLLDPHDGGLQVRKWVERQTFDTTGAERARRYRENKKTVTASSRRRNGIVTGTEQSRAEHNKVDKKRDSKESPPPSEEATAYKEYVATAENLSLPVGRLNPLRRSKLRARLKEHGLQGWLRALENLKHSPFCLGEGPRGWKADLDFLLSPQKLERLLEGAYGGAPPERKSRGVHELEKFEQEFPNVIGLRPKEDGQRVYPQLSGPTNGCGGLRDAAHQIVDVLPAGADKADWQDSS